MQFNGSDSVRIETVMVTGSFAEDAMSRGKPNRHTSPSRVSGYSRDMLAGKWVLTHQGIAFDENDELGDGWHRMSAVAMAARINPDIKVPMTVAYGVKRSAFMTVDGGYTRTLAHTLGFNGYSDTSQLAAVANRAFIWDLGKPWTGYAQVRPTKAEVLEFISKHPDLHEAATFGHRWVRGAALLAPSLAGFCWWLFQALDREDADAFMTSLADGAGLESGDAVLTLRDRFMAMHRPETRGAVPRRHRPETYVAFTIMAWNKYRDCEKISKYQAPRGGFTNENFPRPID